MTRTLSGSAFRLVQSIGCLSILAFTLVASIGCPGGGGGGGGKPKGPVNLTGKPPAPPIGLTATAGDGQVTLSWTASSGATVYVVLRATKAGGPYSEIATTTATSYTDTGLADGTTYYYVIQAADAAGASGDSTESSGTPTALGPSVLPAPGGLAAVGGTGEVSLSWGAVAGATGYAVLRSLSPGGPYTEVASISSTTFTDLGVSPGTTYYYVVQAGDAQTTSPSSSEASASTDPGAPTGLQATGGYGLVSLTWSAVQGATGYAVLRGFSSGGPFDPVGTATGTSFADGSVSNGQTYFYEVEAWDASGGGLLSASVSALTAPPSPSPLSATAANGGVLLSWSVAQTATGYLLSRGTSPGGPYSQIANPAENSYLDLTVSNGTTYYYVAQAVNASGPGGSSNEAGATPSDSLVPLAPTGLTATGGNQQVALTWSASSPATGYEIFRSFWSGGPYTPIASAAGTSFTDTGLANGTTYYYVVKAADTGGLSAGASNEAGATTTPVPQPPANLTATSGNAQATLSWTASAGATGYAVFDATVSGGPYAPVGTTTSSSFRATGLTNLTTYYFVVVAANLLGMSLNSNEVSVLPLAPPTGLNAVGGSNQISLSWSPSSGASGYAVLRSTSSGGPYTQVSTPGGTTWTDAPLPSSTTYFYMVEDIVGGTYSAPSTEVSGTTYGPPQPPTGLAAVAGDTQVQLSWNAATANPPVTDYSVYRSTTSGGPYTLLITFLGLSYNVTGLTNTTTYYYVVRAWNSVGESNASSQVSAIPLTIPSGFTASGSGTQISLGWNVVTGATGYLVSRSSVSGGPYTLIATINSGSTNTFTDSSGLASGTTYYYVVQATFTQGTSADSAEVSATTAPLAPMGLAATGGGGQVVLSWSAGSGATGYAVFRSTVSGSGYTLIGTTPSLSFTDGTASAGTTYYYVVQAANGAGVSGNSVEASAETASPAPTGLTAVGGTELVSLSWNSAPGATGYLVLESLSVGGPYGPAGTSSGATFTATGLADGTVYYFEVEAANVSGGSPPSATASALTNPAPPSAVVGTGGYGQVSLSWTSALSATGYEVFRSGSVGGPFSPVGATAGTSLVDGGLTNGATWYYVVESANTTGSSGYSTVVTGVTAPPIPTGVGAAGGYRQATVSWSSASAATGYEVFGATSMTGPWSPAGTTTGTVLTVTGLTDATTYYFDVEAMNGAGMSSTSAAASALTIPGIPRSVQAYGGGEQVQVQWLAPLGGGATTYVVSRGLTSGGPYGPVATTAALNATDTGLGDGVVYYYVVQAGNASGLSPDSLEAWAQTIPTAPVGLSAVGATQEAYLSWSAAVGATGYVLLRSTVSGGPYAPVATVATTSDLDTGLLPATTYYYVVRAADGSGTSGNSSQVAALTIPAPPTGVTATGGSLVVSLSWTGSAGATSYDVFRSTSPGGPFSSIGTTGSTSYVDNSVSAGTWYFYVVEAGNASGWSPDSSQASTVTIPPAPTIFSASWGGWSGGYGQVNVSYGGGLGATDYVIGRSLSSGGPYSAVATGNFSFGDYHDTGLAPGTTYYYVVWAVDASGTSPSSPEASALTAPAAPLGLTATGGVLVVTLAWNASTSAVSYAILRSTGSGYSQIATTTSTTFADTGVTSGTWYSYEVDAVNASGSSPDSSAASAWTAPAPPAGVVAAGAPSGALVSWIGSSTATGYVVLRSLASGGPYAPAGTTTGVSFSDTGLISNTTYYYVVEASSSSGTSGPSLVAGAETSSDPPTGLSAVAVGTQIDLSWSAPTGASGYEILRSGALAGPYAPVGVTGTTAYVDPNLVAGTTFFYEVAATNGSAWSAPSAPGSATTAPPAPLALTATGLSDTTVAVNWTAVRTATSYLVLRAPVSGGPYTTVGAVVTSFVDTGLTASTAYFYVVEAVNAAGASPASTQASAVTAGSPTAPLAPAGFTATVGVSFALLNWTASAGATEYLVFRSLTPWGPYAQVGATTAASLTDPGLTEDTSYRYVVEAVGASGQSGTSVEVSVTTPWAKTYGGTNDEEAFSIQQTSDGGFIVAGYTTSFGAGRKDFWVLKLSPGGTVAWQKTYGGTDYDYANSIRQTSDGGYIVAGSTGSFQGSWILKLDADGNAVWQKTYASVYNVANSIRQTSDGGYVVLVDNNSVLKLFADGSVAWQKKYGGTINSIEQTSDGGYILAGVVFEFVNVWGYDVWIAKLNSDGTIAWQEGYGGRYDDGANSIQQTTDGGYVAAGWTTDSSGFTYAWILKLNATGGVVWQQDYGVWAYDRADSVQQTNDGGYLVGGFKQSGNVGLLKLNPSGTVAWMKSYGGAATDQVYSVQQTNDGGIIVAGSTASFGAGGLDFWVLKLASDGGIVFNGASGASMSSESTTVSVPPAGYGTGTTTVTGTSVSPFDTGATVSSTIATVQQQAP